MQMAIAFRGVSQSSPKWGRVLGREDGQEVRKGQEISTQNSDSQYESSALGGRIGLYDLNLTPLFLNFLFLFVQAPFLPNKTQGPTHTK